MAPRISAHVHFVALLLVIGFLSAPMSRAQSLAKRPEFETASIKINASGGSTSMSFGSKGVAAKNTPLRQLIGMAYQIRDFQVSGGPAWIDSDRYDIEAKPGTGPMAGRMTKESMLESMAKSGLMLQSLLEDRFKLKLHRETKELPVYALTVAKGGIRMQRSKETSCLFFDWHSNDLTPGGCGAIEAGPNVRLNHTLDALAMSVSGRPDSKVALLGYVSGDLTTFLSNCCRLDRLIVDKTGLNGLFDLHLEWSRSSTADPASADEFTNPSIFTALQ